MGRSFLPPVLNICGFYLLLWAGYYTNRVSDHRWGKGADGSYLALAIELTSQEPALLYLGIGLWLTSLQPLHDFHLP